MRNMDPYYEMNSIQNEEWLSRKKWSNDHYLGFSPAKSIQIMLPRSISDHSASPFYQAHVQFVEGYFENSLDVKKIYHVLVITERG